MAYGPLASGYNDGHGLAPAHRDGDVLDPDRDRVAPDDALMQDLDPGAFDEAELDQPAFEFNGRQRGVRIVGGETTDDAGIAAPGQSERQFRGSVIWFSHDLYFQ